MNNLNPNSNIDNLCIANIRLICAEMIDKAQSGHPGMAIGAAPILHTLYTRFIKASTKDDKWPNRDHFILSGGHASSLIYTILHLAGYNITKSDLQKFRSLNSITPGHPEFGVTPGIDATTGPLGQGMAEAVGIAIAEEYLRAKTDNLINHFTYVLCGDGDMQEGLSQEAISLAGHLSLSNLIVLYDSNDIQLDGEVNKCNTENTKKKYEAMGWFYQLVEDGNNCEEIARAIKKAQNNGKPSLIEVKTIIGYGTKNQGTAKVHGAPLAHEETVEMRTNFGGETFSIKEEVYNYYQGSFIKRGNAAYNKWQKQYKAVDNNELNALLYDSYKIDYNNVLTKFDKSFNGPTRKAGGMLLQELSKVNYGVIGGSADLASSTMAQGADGSFAIDNRLGRHINFGVREHAMASIANGLALHNLRSFCSSFFAFSDYLKPAVRMAGLIGIPTMFIFSHDSIAVGEDGPTHHPIEQLTMLRSIPNVNVIRPADANETREAYILAMESKKTPTVIVLSRQNLPTIFEASVTEVSKGAYIVVKEEKEIADGILIASGSEVSITLEAQKILKDEGYDVRVVSMPSTTIFNQQSDSYKEEILPKTISRKMAIEMSEAAHYYKYVGTFGRVYGIDKFGVSASGPVVIKEYGFTVEKIVEAFKQLEKVDFIHYVE